MSREPRQRQGQEILCRTSTEVSSIFRSRWSRGFNTCAAIRQTWGRTYPYFVDAFRRFIAQQVPRHEAKRQADFQRLQPIKAGAAQPCPEGQDFRCDRMIVIGKWQVISVTCD
jgi:predicted amidophosphoribosyltransferase